ncbi:MAG TPA: DUF1080 domain-containing protein, partial [Parafilimonas sp.]|nr:DUF1080 domain-containing protein [Parafilimonas sp.]
MKKLFFSLYFLCIGAILWSQNEQGFQDLFDGKTLNGWKRLVGAGEYTVENNMIVGTTVAGSP